MTDEKEKAFEYAIEFAEKGGHSGRAISIALRYGQIDGDHHKAWVIDQMLRALTGEGYDDWVALYEQDGEYEWDTGIAP